MSLVHSRSGGWLLVDAATGRPREVCVVREACRRLSLSRRQVYRLIASRTIAAHGKIFGEWLLDRDGVERLARFPASAQPIPAKLKTLFPEYEVSRLNAGRDRMLLISRVLDRGRLKDVRWLIGRLPKRDILRFLKEDGARLMSRRSLRFWSLFFNVVPKPLPQWRTKANPWLSAGL